MGEAGIPIIGPILNKLIGTRNERFVKKYTQRVREISAFEGKMRVLTDAELRGKIKEFRDRAEKGAKADDLMVEAFAAAREAMDRAVGIRNIFNPKTGFDVSKLPTAMQELYHRTKAEMDALPVLVPATYQPKQNQQPPSNAVPDSENEFLGMTDLVPGWMRHPIAPELYEAVRALYPESRPPFRARPFDVQLIGGMVLTQGKIAEMKTGEGKTIVAPLATYLACVERLKVHVVTVNDYLVQRDRDWTAPFFWALGLTVGAIHPQHMQDEDQKRLMYRCDVVYGTTAEFGFDYLRDNMKRSADQQVQKRRQFAIVDEVDSILIDEARTPLIISGQAHEDSPRYELADRLARHLVERQKPWDAVNEKVERCKLRIKGFEGDIRQARDKGKIPDLQKQLAAAKEELPKLEAERDTHKQYYEVKLERKQAHLTHEGVSEAQRAAGIGSFYVDQNIDVPHLLEQALRAHVVYERDKDYVVMPQPNNQTGRVEPSIVIVDVNTGRPMVGRQWSDGLHQAIECKERVPIKQETQTVATITIQNFFKMYKRLAGMTGTADTEAQEFHDIYKLDVVAIPTNRQVTRRDFDDLVFLTARDKWAAITDEIKAFHDAGRPILVGTTSVEKSETLSRMLTSTHGIQHEVLNAKQHERESLIIEGAGQLGAVMIATNMAGRGTDIKLGPVTREALLNHWLRRGLAPRTLTVDATDDMVREQIFRKIAPAELEINKRDAESMAFDELEIRLLRRWAIKYTWLSEKAVSGSSPEELRKALDEHGRFILHRIRWYGSVEELGGLHVIGTERHEARRIDNQLRGRSGRQGDRGSSRFYVSLEDDLMKMFAGETTQRVLARLGMKEGDAIEHPMLSKSVERAQRKVEERNFQIRKNVLEYDEVMEYQRQTFYGMRQRVLEGRDVKGLIFDFINKTVEDAADTYLDPDYPFQCAADFANAKLDCSVTADRLRGKNIDEMIAAIADEAKHEARQSIDLTLGEYIPLEGSEISVDFDSAGLISWARSRFGIEINAADLREGGAKERQHVRDLLVSTAESTIDKADLSGLVQYTEPNYGARELAKWAKDKLSVDVTVDEILAAMKKTDDGVTPVTVLMAKVEDAYTKREVEYPVDYALEVTRLIAQRNMQEGADVFLNWANQRFQMGWSRDFFKSNTPANARKLLLEASRKFHAEKLLDKEIAEALACRNDAELDAYFQKRFGRGMPESMKWLEGQEREDAIRARIESILRAELLQFERTITLDVFDSTWKDHLYAMDQLRDSISFRAFSQQDPRIEYKREGSHMFTSVMDTMRERITEYVFKARISPAMPQQARPPMGPGPAAQFSQPRPAQARPAPAGAAVAPMAGAFTAPGMIGGPGPGDGMYAPPPSPRPNPPATT